MSRTTTIDTDDEDMLAPRQTNRGRNRQQAREPGRASARGEVFVGRDGAQLTRTRIGGIDQFEIPKEIIPKGWDYQWNVVSVYNNADVVRTTSNRMYMNGWRAVPADRHDGLFMPIGHKVEIIVDGQRLEERPKAMSEQAKAEDEDTARRQMRDRDQALMGGKANLRNAMNNGIEMSDRYRGTGGNLRMSIDPALDVPAPAYQPPEPGE